MGVCCKMILSQKVLMGMVSSRTLQAYLLYPNGEV